MPSGRSSRATASPQISRRWRRTHRQSVVSRLRPADGARRPSHAPSSNARLAVRRHQTSSSPCPARNPRRLYSFCRARVTRPTVIPHVLEPCSLSSVHSLGLDHQNLASAPISTQPAAARGKTRTAPRPPWSTSASNRGRTRDKSAPRRTNRPPPTVTRQPTGNLRRLKKKGLGQRWPSPFGNGSRVPRSLRSAVDRAGRRARAPG